MVKKKIPIIWDNEAKKSLRSIYYYIKARESVRAARKVRDKIISETRSLNNFPEKFEQEHNLENELGNIRYKVVWSYKVIYEVTDESIYILDIFHTSRDPSSIRSGR